MEELWLAKSPELFTFSASRRKAYVQRFNSFHCSKLRCRIIDDLKRVTEETFAIDQSADLFGNHAYASYAFYLRNKPGIFQTWSQRNFLELLNIPRFSGLFRFCW